MTARRSLHIYVPNVDAFFECAVAADRTMQKPASEQFGGDRTGSIEILLAILDGLDACRKCCRCRAGSS